MDLIELGQAVNRQIEQAYWPWWFAVAYVQPKPARYDALRGGVETHLAFKGSSVDAAGALGRVVAVLCGIDDPDSETFGTWRARAEDRLTMAIRAGHVRGWGRTSPRLTPVEINPSDWIGGEIDCSETCDLVREGWRDLCGVDRALNGERVVWFSDIHLPRDQVMAWADHLEREEAQANLDDALAGDYEAFAALESDGHELEGGFWSAFVACAWVGSRCQRFTAAAQAYERAKLVERGGHYSAAAWLVLDNVMGERFGVTMTQASTVIKGSIADRIFPAGSGYDLATGQSREIARAEWLRMARSHDQHGTSLVPGVYGVSWSSVDVRNAFPQPEAEIEPAPDGADCQPSKGDDLRGTMPSYAKPNDVRYEEDAHEVARIMRADRIRFQTAARQHFPTTKVGLDSAIRATRSAFEKMYDLTGLPLKN